jgi:hypothetical protein
MAYTPNGLYIIEEHFEDKWYTVRFEVFTAVNMTNVVFRDIKPQFILHRRHITSALQIPVG